MERLGAAVLLCGLGIVHCDEVVPHQRPSEPAGRVTDGGGTDADAAQLAPPFCPDLGACELDRTGLLVVYTAPPEVELLQAERGRVLAFDARAKQYVILRVTPNVLDPKGPVLVEEGERLPVGYDRVRLSRYATLACAGEQCDFYISLRDGPLQTGAPQGARVPFDGCAAGMMVACLEGESLVPFGATLPFVATAADRVSADRILVGGPGGRILSLTRDGASELPSGAGADIADLSAVSEYDDSWAARTTDGRLILGNRVGRRTCGFAAKSLRTEQDREVDSARPLQFTSGNAYYQTAFLERDRYGNAISCARVDLPPGIRSIARNQCADARTVMAIDSKRVYAQPPLCYVY
ncbi:MAG: hypothetical protein HOO96_28625 [Polyangiaceae bacterium]|nr:hypothetical protein [Polyangiaceae bacterium]